MSKKILITGASGLIGTRLTALLRKEGHEIIHLSYSLKKTQGQSYHWNPQTDILDPEAIRNTGIIIHLAGTGIADKRWSKKRKQEILDSRVRSTRLLAKALQQQPHTVKTVICASAIGYYGFGNEDQVFTEADSSGKDFLAEVVRQWEQEADQFQLLNIRVVKIRIGMVLSEKGGALPKMATPIKLGIGAPLGRGNQYVSWIHVDDLCRIFIRAVNDEKMYGVYNGVTDWCTNADMTKAIAAVLRKPLWLPSVPAFVLKIVLGEMAGLVLKGSKISSEKIKNEGFVFQYLKLHDALQALLRH
ncbi:MAG: TIGR01777 family oxidoreductase [Bacteroidetes bacterium]|nr:TIGR01777 family oxidoreductase [Bacteroidota bacterium]MBS1540053.1 TIGR01777 family oxidoreductase [Bacteroidota bacterium]